MREVDPMKTDRAVSWKLYIDAPMPMVTIFKTLDISCLMERKEQGYKLNMLLCYCIALEAGKTKEFRLLPVGKKMMEYDKIGVNVIVANTKGGINSCDLPYTTDLEGFRDIYLNLTEKAAQTCEDHEIQDHMIVGTSNLAGYEIDGVINMYSGIYNNPFLIGGKYRQEGERTLLQVSFQFHHVQMDGREACGFLERLQKEIDGL